MVNTTGLGLRFNRVRSRSLRGFMLLVGFGLLPFLASVVSAQEAPVRGSIVEDRAARKLLEAGDARLEADETEKAVEIWRSVIERYPGSRMRYEAHMRLGNFLLENKRAFDEARGHFESVDVEANMDSEQRSDAALKTGICFYEGRHYGHSFKTLRRVIEEYPASAEVNSAYYYIGLGHFKLGHYSRAIEALEKVGTALTGDDAAIEKVEAGKRFFVKVGDQDLAVLEPGETIEVRCVTTQGDEESVICYPLGRQVRVVLGSMPTQLAAPVPGNGRLEVQGGDRIKVHYVDAQTADRKFDQERSYEVAVVGSALVEIKDGSFGESLAGVVIGKQANLEVTDPDYDRGPDADSLKAIAEIWREKSQSEIDEEVATAVAERDPLADPEKLPEIERYKKIDSATVLLEEVRLPPEAVALPEEEEEVPTSEEVSETPAEGGASTEGEIEVGPGVAEDAPDEEGDEPEVIVDTTIHSGIFRGTVRIEPLAEPVAGDAILQATPGDSLKLRYLDELHLGPAPVERIAEARCIEGNLGNVRVTKTDIDDAELRIKTKLRSSDALTHIGDHYKDFGLQSKADLKYEEALATAGEVLKEARQLGGSILENTYVQLWRTYFAMGNYNLAVSMSQRLMQEFPESTFVDEAMLKQADAFREQAKFPDAIRLYGSILRLNDSPLKGEAQFGIAESYETMASQAQAQQSEQLYERAFVEYQKVYEQFPDSGRVGDSVAKMANFYYKKQDYSRAIDVFENVLSEYPDANFLDVILFNYGRCLFRLERRPEARRMFDQLINEFPESSVAGEAKRISDALVKAGF